MRFRVGCGTTVAPLVSVAIWPILLRHSPRAHSQIAIVGACYFVCRPVKERVKAASPRVSSQARLCSSARRFRVFRDTGNLFIVKFGVKTKALLDHAEKARHQVLAIPFIFLHAQ